MTEIAAQTVLSRKHKLSRNWRSPQRLKVWLCQGLQFRHQVSASLSLSALPSTTLVASSGSFCGSKLPQNFNHPKLKMTENRLSCVSPSQALWYSLNRPSRTPCLPWWPVTMREECNYPNCPILAHCIHPVKRNRSPLSREGAASSEDMQDSVTGEKKRKQCLLHRQRKYLLKRIWGQGKSKYGILKCMCGI